MGMYTLRGNAVTLCIFENLHTALDLQYTLKVVNSETGYVKGEAPGVVRCCVVPSVKDSLLEANIHYSTALPMLTKKVQLLLGYNIVRISVADVEE